MQLEDEITTYSSKIDGILRSSQRISTIADKLQSYSPLPAQKKSRELLKQKVEHNEPGHRANDSLSLSWSFEEQYDSSNDNAEQDVEKIKLPPLQGPHALKLALRILQISERARALQIDLSTKSSGVFPVVRANQILQPSALHRTQSLTKIRDRNAQAQTEMLRRFKWRRNFHHEDSFGQDERRHTGPIICLDQLDNFPRQSSRKFAGTSSEGSALAPLEEGREGFSPASVRSLEERAAVSELHEHFLLPLQYAPSPSRPDSPHRSRDHSLATQDASTNTDTGLLRPTLKPLSVLVDDEDETSFISATTQDTASNTYPLPVIAAFARARCVAVSTSSFSEVLETVKPGIDRTAAQERAIEEEEEEDEIDEIFSRIDGMESQVWEIARRLKQSRTADGAARPAVAQAQSSLVAPPQLVRAPGQFGDASLSGAAEAGGGRGLDATADGGEEEERLDPYTAIAIVEPDPTRDAQSGWWEVSKRSPPEEADIAAEEGE